MAKQKFCYTDWDEELWAKTPEEIKIQAKKIYNTCKKSSNKIEKIPCQMPTYTANAIGFQFFRYDMYAGNLDWYENIRQKDGSKLLKININKFNKLLVRNQQIEEEIKRIKKYLKLGLKSDYDKAAAIHDYLCECADYNYGFLTDDNDERGPEIYDVLFGHIAICCGYSDTFKAICDYIGLKCDCVSNDDHEWNRVWVNGEWLYLDITWDDETGYIGRRYFLKKENDFYAIHPSHTAVNYDVWEV